MKILVVDDETLHLKGIKFNLETEGYEVDTAGDGMSAVKLARANNYNLILLDIMMPRMNGLEACMKIREFSNVPIIILTARGEDADKLIGFEYGADDYITKPFNLLELKARIRALLRRSIKRSEEYDTVIVADDLTIDLYRRIALRGDKRVELTAREFDVIELLAKNPGRVYSRERILDIIWGVDYQGDSRAVDVHIRHLREKLETNPAEPQLILTKWGVGYYFKG